MPNRRQHQIHVKSWPRLLAFMLPALAVLVFAVVSILGDIRKGGGSGASANTPAPSIAAMPTPQPTPPRATKTPEPETASDWRLTVVNAQNELPANYKAELRQLKNEQSVDVRCYPDLQQMMDDCRAENLQPLICSSYRTTEKQQSLYDEKVQQLVGEGKSEEEAKTEAAKEIALPGTSEHQLGLAVDIVDTENQNLDDSQADTKTQKWLLENSWKYGFILRYPKDKEDITGVVYEPWHYRYVGKDYAKQMHDEGLCLEEFVSKYGNSLTTPAESESPETSPSGSASPSPTGSASPEAL